MITATDRLFKAAELSNLETEMARVSGQAIANFVDGDGCVQLTLSRENGEQVEAKVPVQAVYLLAYILAEMAKGNPVTLVPTHAELSTIEAAGMMRVSRPYLIKLLEEGKIPFRLVGTHRRVRYEDLLAFMDEEKKQRKEVLKELIAEQEQLGLYE